MFLEFNYIYGSRKHSAHQHATRVYASDVTCYVKTSNLKEAIQLISDRAKIYRVVIISTALILLATFTTPFLKFFFNFQHPDAFTLLMSRIFIWCWLFVIWIYSRTKEKQSFLLWSQHNLNVKKIVAHVILLLVAVIIVMIPVRIILNLIGDVSISPKFAELKPILKEYKSLLIFIAVTAGITEELIFRGYLQPRFEAIFKTPFLSISITSSVFALTHIAYGTITNFIGPLIIGVIFSTYYWKFRNIKTLIICHTLIDLLALYSMLKNPHL